MLDVKTVCICGGGSLGHVIAAVLGNKGCRVNLLTGHPAEWSNELTVSDSNNKVIKGKLHTVSNNAKEVIPSADMVLLCLPGYLIEKTLLSIKPYITHKTYIGSVVCSNGFFWIARHVLGKESKLFGFQRVPYICRVKEYGESAVIKGYKSKLKIAGSENVEMKDLSSFFTQTLETPTIPLKHYLEATLTNSNPILHPARIYGMLSRTGQEAFEKELLFYEDWGDYSSEVLINCDNEFQQLLDHLPVNRDEIPTILSHYESTDIPSLTRKIRSIEAFKGIKMGMIKRDDKYYIDYSNRYFTEDIPYGLLIIKSVAVALKKETPCIDTVIQWMQSKMGKEYLVGNQLKGKDLVDSGIMQNFGMYKSEDLL